MDDNPPLTVFLPGANVKRFQEEFILYRVLLWHTIVIDIGHPDKDDSVVSLTATVIIPNM